MAILNNVVLSALSCVLILGLIGFNPAFATPWGVSLSGNGAANSYTEFEKYNVEYNISGSYSFDINVDHSVQGSGTAQISLHSIDQYCTGDSSVTVSYSVTGTYDAEADVVYLTISNSNPSSLAFIQHCDYPADEESPAESFDETVTLASPFNFQHNIGPGLHVGSSTSGVFSEGYSSFWMGSDINSQGSLTLPDTIPPVVVVPNDMTIQAARSNPLLVPFSVSATDDVDGNVSPACSHVSGSNFPIGITTVTCTATDAAGNSASESFTITILEPEQTETVDTITESVDTITESVDTITESADTITESADTITESADTITESVDTTTTPKITHKESDRSIQTISEPVIMPAWIKHNAKWWADDAISDNDFTSGIEFMIKQDIIKIPQIVSEKEKSSFTLGKIPTWIKSNAKWWSEDLISDQDFVNGIEFLIKEEIIKV